MKIISTDDKVIFEFDRYDKRYDPYDEEYYDSYPVFTGLIVRNGTFSDEMGFAGTIDMGYKSKPDQCGDFIVKWYGTEEDFRKECEKLNIDIHEIEA